MAQGTIKKSKAPTSSKRSNVLGPKKGARTIAPKRVSLIKQKRVTKKHTSGLITKTERNLAEKAGHLEMLAGGKNSKGKGKVDGDGKKGQKK